MVLDDLRSSLQCASLRGGGEYEVRFAKRIRNGKYEIEDRVEIKSMTVEHSKRLILINTEDSNGT